MKTNMRTQRPWAQDCSGEQLKWGIRSHGKRRTQAKMDMMEMAPLHGGAAARG